jgi:hypothetical protein
MVDNTNQPEQGEGLTAAMDNVQRKYGRPNPDAPQRSFAERSRAAWRYVRPHYYRTAWWSMLAISFLVISLDLDAYLGGKLGSTLHWMRDVVLRNSLSIPFVLGVLACYFVFFKGRHHSKDEL